MPIATFLIVVAVEAASVVPVIFDDVGWRANLQDHAGKSAWFGEPLGLPLGISVFN